MELMQETKQNYLVTPPQITIQVNAENHRLNSRYRNLFSNYILYSKE